MSRRVVRSLLLASVVSACAQDDGGPVGGLSPQFSAAGGSATERYLVLAKQEQFPADFAARLEAAGGRIVDVIPQIGVAVVEGGSAFPGRAARLDFVDGLSTDDAVQWLDAQESGVAVEAVETEAVTQENVNPAVEGFYGFQWAPQAVQAPEAWAAGVTGRGARVAVLDGGIHGTHLDLRDRVDVSVARSFTTGAWNTDVGTFWHGTHVAGIVAASANGIGTIGIAPNATIVPVKVLHNGSGPFSSIINGIVYAATPIAQGGGGAHVINMSLGATLDEKAKDIKGDVRELKKAVDRATAYAYRQGVLVIASAGNGATNFDQTTLFKTPAQNAHVVSVSSTGPKGWLLGATDFERPAYYTDHGKSLVTLAAPGGNAELIVIDGNNSLCTRSWLATTITNRCGVFDQVLSTSRGSGPSVGSYSWAQGTSMAAPAAAGIAALIIEKNGGPMHPSLLLARMQQSAIDLGKSGNDIFYGGGWVNAFRAVR